MFKMCKILLLLIFGSCLASSPSINGPKYWLNSCSDCSLALNTCENCFGEIDCKKCIVSSKPECSLCVNEIFNKEYLETIGGNEYLLCEKSDSLENKICQFYCRGKYSEWGQCKRLQNLPVCQCSESTLDLNGKLKLNITISDIFRRVYALPNGDLVKGLRGSTVQIWDTKTGVVKRNLTSDLKEPNNFGLLSNGDLVVAYFANKALVVWDLNLADRNAMKRFIQTEESIWCLIVLKNDDLVIGQQSGSFNYDIVIRNSNNGTVRKRLIGHTSNVYQIIQLPSGELASCSLDKTVRLWDPLEGVLIKNITQPDFVYSIVSLKNGLLASGLSDGTIRIWNLNTGSLVRTINAHKYEICRNGCLQVLNNGDLLSASFDKSLKISNPDTGLLKATFGQHSSYVQQITFLPNGNLVSASNSEICIWS